MRHVLALLSALSCWLLVIPPAAHTVVLPNELMSEADDDVAGDWDGTTPVSKALQDTVWIADWRFDAACDAPGWVTKDQHRLFDGSNYWCVTADYAGAGGAGNIIDNAAVLRSHNLCWARDGYGNLWDYSLILKYQGGASGGGTAPTLTFKFVSDSENGNDFVTVECDSLGLSESRANDGFSPIGPEFYREEIFSTSGVNNPGTIGTPLQLVDYTSNDPTKTHEVYIRFESDGAYSDEDGDYPTLFNATLVVDNIVVGGTLAYSENFEAASGCATTPAGGGVIGVNPNITLQNTQPDTPFAPNPSSPAPWARIFRHITDNDKCTENTTCAWLNTDPSRTRFFPDMGFAPGGAIVRNWLDDLIISPWVSLTSTPSATGTVLHWRRFPGNNFNTGRIVQGWRVRGQRVVNNTDTSTLGDSIACVLPWGHTSSFAQLSTFSWISSFADMTAYFDPLSTQVQISYRVTDWQLVGEPAPPTTLNTGPGPFNDRVRIGRYMLGGPVISEGIDSRSQSQDAFGAVVNAIPGGEHHSPATGPNDRHAPVPFNQSTDIAIGRRSPRNASGVVVANNWFFDLPDTYMRGGDEIVYFWWARDNGGLGSSDPVGIRSLPNGDPDVTSIADAENQTGGLLGMSALPAINWAPSYLSAIAASLDGNVTPTQAQIDASPQAHCILYYNNAAAARRRSSDQNRTSFMFTLDRLGYRGHYDVYDQYGSGNSNNQLGGRATVAQARGYALIIHDSAHSRSQTVPEGINLDSEKINQAGWYRSYLANGLTSDIGTATVWFVGDNIVSGRETNPLFSTDVGVALGSVNNGTGNLNPDVLGKVSFTFQNGGTQNFTLDKFSVAGGCPTVRDYDGLNLTTATGTHKYKSGNTESPFWATAMNKNSSLKWNTILSSFTWGDVRDAFCEFGPCQSPGRPAAGLLGRVLAGVLPGNCQRSEEPTSIPDQPNAPGVTALHQNVPNPFNPSTTIRFDLAHDAHVELVIFDVSGRRVRGLVNANMNAGFPITAVWDGLDDGGKRVAGGVYLYRLVAGEFTATRKMIVLK